LTLAACASAKVAEKGLTFLGLAMTIIFVAAFTEELVFRGIVLHALSRAWGGIAGVLVSSVLFALVHFPSRLDEISDQPAILPVMALSYFGFGVFMCRVRVATGSIWWATAIHTLSNFVTYAYLWGGLGSGWAMGVMKIGLDATGLLLAVSLPIYEKFANGRLFLQIARWRIPIDLGVPYHRKLWAQALMSPKVQARWSALIRGRVVGGVRQPIEEQKSSVRS
jgi:hypothetical protein